jgi:hypothetical protein
MKISIRRIAALCLLFLILPLFDGCGGSPRQRENRERETYNLERFQTEIRQKGYPCEIQDVEKNYIPAERKRMKLGGDESVAVYLFGSNQEMKAVAKNIARDGGGYWDGSKGVCVDFAYPVNYYKMGSLIVEYVGKNDRINSDLTDLLGWPFAGDRQAYFGLGQFQAEMQAREYSGETQDVERNYIPAEQKQMHIGLEVVTVYLFSDSPEMESTAKHISTDGSGYSDISGTRYIHFSGPVHYYKMGTLIAEYVGESDKINSDLTDIFGEPFAGNGVTAGSSSNP